MSLSLVEEEHNKNNMGIHELEADKNRTQINETQFDFLKIPTKLINLTRGRGRERNRKNKYLQ
jgi:hypothetical protein